MRVRELLRVLVNCDMDTIVTFGDSPIGGAEYNPSMRTVNIKDGMKAPFTKELYEECRELYIRECELKDIYNRW